MHSFCAAQYYCIIILVQNLSFESITVLKAYKNQEIQANNKTGKYVAMH